MVGGSLAASTQPVPVRQWFLGRWSPQGEEGPVTVVPPIPAGWTVAEEYDIDAGVTRVRILRDERTGETVYQPVEPKLTPRETEIYAFVLDALVRGLNNDPGEMDASERRAFLEEAVDAVVTDYRIPLTPTSRGRILYQVHREFLGYGVIDVMMRDGAVEDISCDGHEQPLFVFHRRHESIASTVRFADADAVDGYVIRLAQRSGKAITISQPILDAALPDGSRLQATLGQEVTQNGSTFTIRRFRAEPLTPIDLVRFGTLDASMMAYFWILVEYGANLILSGGTASGKTTSLNAFGQFIPPPAKIVTIEDTREVNLPHRNWVKSVTRAGTGDSATGEIGMFDLLKASLRQRPDYILVGEVRGIEASVAFQAMATGHTVYSTMHADSARSVVYRLENEPINVPRLVLQALDVIAIQTQVRVGGKRLRRLQEVVEIVGIDPQTRELLTQRVFLWNAERDEFRFQGRSVILEKIARERGWSDAAVKKVWDERTDLIERMVAAGVNDSRAIAALVRRYYRDPAEAETWLQTLEARA